jgi:pimeloyl-ACP methyl ester carboxylesterase
MKKLFVVLLSIGFAQNIVAQSIPYGYNSAAGAYFEVRKDVKLYYETYGAGEPLLMLHGGVYGYIDEFEFLIPKLAEKYKVVCLATRGHVKSDIGHEPLTYEQRANDAFKLLEHLGLEKVTVIGFSDGGFSAYKLAAFYPDAVEKMVVMGAGDRPEARMGKNSSYSAESLMASSGDYFKKRVANMPEPERWDESLRMLSDLYNTSVVSKETFEKIRCPVLVMSGDNDEYSNAESVLTAYRNLSDARLSLIPGCGHVILYCNFPAVWESMKGFLGFDK